MHLSVSTGTVSHFDTCEGAVGTGDGALGKDGSDLVVANVPRDVITRYVPGTTYVTVVRNIAMARQGPTRTCLWLVEVPWM